MKPTSPAWLDFLKQRWDLLGWILLLAWANRPLLHKSVNTSFVYLSGPVAAGEWWRLLSYPLIHLSGYHLFLDGFAFLLLYDSLREHRRWARLAIIASCSTTSLVLGLWVGDVATLGLCGLSGIAHGLMAFSALEMTRLPRQRLWGWIGMILVAGKSLYEAATGTVVFTVMHMGLCGHPVAASHAGGVLGAMAAFMLATTWQWARSRRPISSLPIGV